MNLLTFLSAVCLQFSKPSYALKNVKDFGFDRLKMNNIKLLAAQGDALQIGSIGIDDDEDDSDDDDGSELSDSEIASSGVTNNSTLTARV